MDNITLTLSNGREFSVTPRQLDAAMDTYLPAATYELRNKAIERVGPPPSNPSGWGTVIDSLQASGWLIVLAALDSAKSTYEVEVEIIRYPDDLGSRWVMMSEERWEARCTYEFTADNEDHAEEQGHDISLPNDEWQVHNVAVLSTKPVPFSWDRGRSTVG